MLKGLTTAGIGQIDGLEAFIEAASAHGFEAIDTGGSALAELLAQKGQEGANEYVNKHNIKIGSIGLPVRWRGTEEQFRSSLEQLVKDAEAAAAFGCQVCCTYVLPSTDQNAAHFMALATRRLRLCAQILNAYGIRLALEFVGPHHLRTKWKNPFIWDMHSTLDWIETIGENNVGLLLDAYHWYTNEDTVEDLLALDASQVVHVHINDAKPVPVAEALDNDRLYPGEGVIDLTSFLKALKEIGYTGVVSQEILTPQPPTESSAVLIKKSADAYESLFRAAGIR